MDVTLLLGSGISRPSEVPGVKDITDFLFSKTYVRNGDQTFSVWDEEEAGPLDEMNSAKHIQDYLSLLKKEHDNYIKQRLGDHHFTTYEDLYSVLDQMEEELKKVSDNYAIIDFLIRQIEVSHDFRERYQSYPELIEHEKFCELCKRFIEWAIKEHLYPEKIEGLDNIGQLADHEDIDTLNIFSLNHDQLLEQYFRQRGISFADGFTELDGDVRYRDIYEWDKGDKVNLYKLHGGVDWLFVQLFPENEQPYQDTVVFSGSKNGIWDIKTESNTKVSLLDDTENFLTGVNKINKYYEGFIGEMHYRFTEQLKKTDRLIVSGFGWSDRPIKNKIFDWLGENEHAMLMIIHGDKEQMIHDSRFLSKEYLRLFEKSDQIEFLSDWFNNASIDKILSFISK